MVNGGGSGDTPSPVPLRKVTDAVIGPMTAEIPSPVHGRFMSVSKSPTPSGSPSLDRRFLVACQTGNAVELRDIIKSAGLVGISESTLNQTDPTGRVRFPSKFNRPLNSRDPNITVPARYEIVQLS